MLRQIKAAYATRVVHERNKLGTTSELEPRSHVEKFEERLIRQGLTPELLEAEQMGINDVLERLDGGGLQCVLTEDTEHKSSAFQYEVDLDEVDLVHYERCPFIEATNKTSGLCLLCVKQGKFSSKPTSFCVEGVDVNEQTLKALSLKEQHSRPSYSADHSWKSFHSDNPSPSKVSEFKIRGGSHNCMSPCRLEHQQSEDSHK